MREMSRARRKSWQSSTDHTGMERRSAVENDRPYQDRVKDGEKDRDREMETMRGETKQVAWVIAWGI